MTQTNEINREALRAELLKDLVYKPHFTGFNKENQGAWSIDINGRIFSYFEGIGHFINTQHHLYNKMITEPVMKKIKNGLRITHDDFHGWTAKEIDGFNKNSRPFLFT